MKMTPLNTTSFFGDLANLDAWLAGRGFAKRDRLRVYKANLEGMAEQEKASDAAQVYSEVEKSGKMTEILTSYVEGIEFVDALKCLREKQVIVPDALLKKALAGPPDAVRENPTSNEGRNAMFELLMGSMVARQDLLPILGQVNPDVEFRFEGRRVLVECKRVLSANKVLANIKQAAKQLEKCIDATATNVGVVAISISRLAHHGDGFWTVPSSDTPHAFLAEGVQNVIRELDPQLRRLNGSAVAGVIFYVGGPFYVQGVGYTTANEGMLYPVNLAETEYLRRLASTLRL
jgi:hypothetical protein